MKKIFVVIAVLLVAFTATVNAQESKSIEFSAGADLVSKYVWRGANGGQGAAFQPALSVSCHGFSLTAWGSTGITDPASYEFDLSLGYSVAGISLALTDYYWDGHGSSYGWYDDSHHLELSVACTLPSVPLTFSVATMLGFFDPKLEKEDGEYIIDPSKNNYSTYINAGYDFTAGDVALTASIGVTPFGSSLWGSGEKKFEFADVSLKGSKELKITDSFSMPVFVQAILTPATEAAHLVFGLSF
ncbi:MAG: hypothetical protein LBJ17_07925 [Dysgonamonadaceae bacterium]|jgi:hypothetical protein|nr:hypothetical protein [Dysgonamonadaceae bacterium]